MLVHMRHRPNQPVGLAESCPEPILSSGAVDATVHLPGPAGRCLRTGSVDEPLGAANPACQESNGRRDGRWFGERLRLVSFRYLRLDRRIDAHRLFEFLDEPIEDRGLREFEFLRAEGLL